jgi:hypothetical protein
VPRGKCDLKYFGNQIHIAYNYFTRQVIYHIIKNLDGQIYIYPDDRNRVKKDNFTEYLYRQLNFESFCNGLNYCVRVVEPRSSEKEIGLQLNDLFLGTVRQIFIPAPGKYKILLSQKVRSMFGFWKKCNIWRWKPKNKR